MKEGAVPDASGLTFSVLASGSRGNAIHVTDGETALLVDAGFSGKELFRRMESVGIDPEGLTAILTSHEHTDHVHGAGILSRKLKIPVFGTRGTLDGAADKIKVPHEVREFTCGVPFCLGRLLIHPFSISHDAADPAGFTITAGACKLGIATDLGIATTLVKRHLAECQALVLEANHDPVMLREGPYPWTLKQRVKSRSGHLSNPDARDLLGELLHNDLRHVVIGHLSEQNNTPEKAASCVAEALNGHDARLHTATQHDPLKPLIL